MGRKLERLKDKDKKYKNTYKKKKLIYLIIIIYTIKN